MSPSGMAGEPLPLPGVPGGAGASPVPMPVPVPASETGRRVPELTGVDLARQALAAAKEAARARGAATAQRKQVRRGGSLRSGARADGRDPLPLGAAIGRLITERGWETPAAVGGVMGRWPQMVGAEVAQHCEPVRYDEDERVLVVQCDGTAWATQIRLLAPTFLARLNADLGAGTVRMIKVLGPGGGWRPQGAWRVPGSGGGEG